jgi:phage terminase small subunit
VPKTKGLSAKQALFVEEYLVDGNATEAAKRAGYSDRSAAAIGAENLKKPAIAAAIAKRQADRAERTEITQDLVIQELAAIAFANVSDLATWSGGRVSVKDSENVVNTALSAVAQVSETQHGITLRMHDKRAALVDLGKHLGMFREKVDLEIRDGADVVRTLFDRLDEYAERVGE